MKVKQVDATLRKEKNMIYVGIDVASSKHDVCIMSKEGQIYGRKFQIQNSKDEYKKLLSKIEEAKKLFKDSKVRIGIESTGVYSSSLLDFVSRIDDYEVIFINSILTNMFQLSQSVHYAKTDKIDAEGICKYLSDTRNKFLTYTKPSYHIQEIKSLYRQLSKINKQITKITNELTGIIHITFPEFFKVFPKIKGKLVLELLIEFPTVEHLRKKHLDTLLSFCKANSKGHFSKDKAELLLSLAKSSIGTYNTSDSLIVKQLASMLNLLSNQKKELINLLLPLVKEYCPILLSIPGIGIINASGIIGEIGNINNFQNANSLLSFAGLDPIVYESGKFKANHTPISKHGSSYLRTALILSSRAIVRNDVTFKTYYDKKRSEGKSYNCSIGHVSKKLVRVIFSLLKNNKEFISINN